jgi:hypothetical protein
MSSRALCCLLSLALAFPPASLVAQTPAGDPEVAKGIRLVDEGDYDGAILTLDTAARRLAGEAARKQELAQAYLYLGIAYVGKGHETAAKAKFREALKRTGDLSLSPDRFPPKVINLFEAARDEVNRAAGSAPGPAAAPEKKGGGHTGLILLGVGVAAAGGVAIAVSGGGKGSENNGLTTNTFPNEVVVFGGGRDFVVDVRGNGTLTARADWQQDGVVLGMYIVNLATPLQVLADGNQTATKQVSLSLAVTPGSYRISVNNSTGMGPRVDTTFTLTVTHP